MIFNNNILLLKYYYIMDELNTEKNTKKTIKSTKNNKISIEDDIDNLTDKYYNIKVKFLW